MRETLVAKRYAKALLEQATEEKALEQVAADFRFLEELSEKGALRLLKLPIVSRDEKQKTLELLLEGKVQPITRNFLLLLLKNHRETYLSQIIAEFFALKDLTEGIRWADVTTPVPLSEAQRNRIIEKLSRESGIRQVKLREKTDPSLIGGIIVQMGDILYDDSVSGKLERIKKIIADPTHK